ncbi:hypothetical protein HELRODRAFT_125879, partial [Helobdella robusta]|uniref:Uncharacterized protein n=1 Tax=Helobdella robusta TaxID=6412 RepID=T1EH74_HELRO
CCVSIRRSYPTNIIILVVMTLAFAVMVGIICSFHRVDQVVIAASATVVITFVLTIFAMQTKIDFTSCGGVMCIISILFIIFAITVSVYTAIWGRSKILMMVYCSIGALVFCLYIIFDTQMIMGGSNRQYQISPEDYIFAVTQLYVDIINLFLMLLRLIGHSEE